MKLSRIRIQNLRCITDLSFNCFNFTTLIGPNNAGKSTALRAVQLLLGNEKPEISEWNHKAGPDAKITIEASFEDLKEWEKTAPGVAGIVFNNRIELRYEAAIDSGKVTISYSAFKADELIEGWDDTWSAITNPTIKGICQRLGIDTSAKWKTTANKEKVRNEIRTNHPELIKQSSPKWSDEGISIAPALQQALPKVLFVPAITDPQEATKPTSKTVFGELLSRIIIPKIKGSSEYQNVKTSLDELKKKMARNDSTGFPEINQVMNAISTRMNDVFPAKVSLTLEEPDFEKVLSGIAGLKINDGSETPIHLQGHGVQRSVIFSLIETLAQQLSQGATEQLNKRATILLFEEPELFMHPHLMRRLRNSLIKMSQADDMQVVCTTHSPFLVNVADEAKSLVIFQRRNLRDAPVSKQLDCDPFEGDERDQLRALLDFHPTVCEAFFASRIVLVEGDTERAILTGLPGLSEHFSIGPRCIGETTIVSCGGKWTIVPVARLLSKFMIPFRVIHDEDRKGKSTEQLANARGFDPYMANEKIRSVSPEGGVYVVADTLEDLIFDEPQSGKDKPYRSWKLLNEDLKGTKALIESKPKLKALFEFAYNW